MMSLKLIVGSGGVLSHAPRRSQAMRMLIDSFQPEGITELAVDSIFMMPQLGILSTFHEQAALEVFHKDCLIRLGTCIAPVGKSNKDSILLSYTITNKEENIKGELKQGEIICLHLPYGKYNCHFNPTSQIDIGCGKGKEFNGLIKGGLEGIFLDGRGREIIFDSNKNDRINQILTWSDKSKEYPLEEK